ncbi:MAG: phosphoethanolamine transferase [Rhodocyclales bacterium]|nr:phosphoethanolamine transferase [Rhodocyclales bacterium]
MSERKKLRSRLGDDVKQRAWLFITALMPMAIWPLSAGILARPMEAAVWALACALLIASPPGRGMRISAWLQILTLPWTFAWIGTIAVTGAGPSNAVMASATAGAFREALMGASLAVAKPSFIVVALLTLGTCCWSLWVTRKAQRQTGSAVSVLFLCCLVPISAVILDGGGFLSFAKIAGPESRISVVWISHMGIAKEALASALNRAAFGSHDFEEKIREASAAKKVFSANAGLGVFIVGESLRADAFLQTKRGQWSEALEERIQAGLGIRLPDACAGANGTFASIPRLLTAVDVSDVEGAARNPTLLAMAKAGGARTAYINNQEIWVLPESGHDLLQKTSSMNMNAYDEVVIEALGDFVKRTGPGPKAALLHLYGEHFYYEKRYPVGLFGEEPPNLSGDALEEFRYGRAAEYGVRVLLLAAAVLDRETEPAFLVFTSDHGENLPSDGTGKRYHTGPSNGRYDTTVPALVLWNKAFQASGRASLLEDLMKAKGLIAHRDVARAWLALEGMPGRVAPPENPMTWGAAEPGGAIGPTSCAALKP